MGDQRSNTENVQNFCIAICVVATLIFLGLLVHDLVDNSKAQHRESRIKKVEAIKACSKTKDPALCIAALEP